MLKVINTNNYIFIGFGNSKSTYTEHGESSTAHSSGVSAGEDVNIMAKENISTFNSKDKKSGSEIGVSFSMNGMSVYGNAYNI